MKRKSQLPGWVLKHKRRGTEVKTVGSGYYLCEVKSVWDPEKKRAKKISGKYLGKITRDGLVKPKHERVLENLKDVTVKEFGATYLLQSMNEDIAGLLKELYPDEWKELFIFSIFRLKNNSPLKNVIYHYNDSYLSEMIDDARVSPKVLGRLLRDIGRRRGRITQFLKEFVTGVDFAVIDLTHVFSLSENVISSTLGHNSKGEYVPQVNLTVLYSLDKRQPAYFRIMPGSIRDVSSVVLTVKEAGIRGVVLLGDKGIYSSANVKTLKEEKIKYILPLKRNSSLIDYGPVESGNRKNFDGYFFFEERHIWHCSSELSGGERVITFLDEKLKGEEEKDFLFRVGGKKKVPKEFYDNQFRLGTISVITDYRRKPKRIFELLKSRVEIENLFDTFKNTLNADRSYMRDDYQMEGWMFVNFIAMLFYYRIYGRLLEKDMLNNYSPSDILLHLSRVRKIRIGDNWKFAEIPKKSRKVIEKLGIDIPIPKNGRS